MTAVEREIQREMWAYGDTENISFSAHQLELEKDEVPAKRPFGHILREREDHDSIAITLSANGHTGGVNGQIVTK